MKCIVFPMNYLLVGNGPTENLAELSNQCDSIIQVNECRHAEILSPEKSKYVFIVNMGHKVSTRIYDKIFSRRAQLGDCRIILTRNEAFYSAKKILLHSRHWNTTFDDYKLTRAWQALRATWPVETVSFLSAVRLERQLRALGMHPHSMPSTGMIAYDWLRRRMKPDDTLTIDGFTFEGWPGHPWAIESRLVRNIGIATETAPTLLAA